MLKSRRVEMMKVLSEHPIVKLGLSELVWDGFANLQSDEPTSSFFLTATSLDLFTGEIIEIALVSLSNAEQAKCYQIPFSYLYLSLQHSSRVR